MFSWLHLTLPHVPPIQALMGQLLIGLINGAFYALLSLGLAIIFGLLNIINFAQGALYMLGAFCAYLLLENLGIGYWPSLVIAPIIVGAFGVVLERLFLRRVYKLDHLYGLLLTFGLALVIQGLFQQQYGSSGQAYSIPSVLSGGFRLPFMFLPIYRAWVIVASLIACVATWFLIERTRLGSYLRAATENASLVQAFGINVPRMITLTYGLGVGLAALAGVMAAPIYQVSPLMGSDQIIVVFAVVVIGGMGSIVGAIVSGFALGIVEGLTKVFWPEASTTVIFVIMVIVLLIRPAGLFGTVLEQRATGGDSMGKVSDAAIGPRAAWLIGLGLLVLASIAPLAIYPVFVMNALCFALFACAFNLLAGYSGLLSLGHATFMGSAAYITAYLVKNWGWGFPPPFGALADTLKSWGLVTPIGILAGTGVAAVMGLVFGWLAIRRTGIYFAMVTLALAQMVYFFCLQAPFTGGEDGIQAVPRGTFLELVNLNNSYGMYYFVLVVFLIGYGIIYRTIHSPFGQVLKAIRENEPRAISLGYNVDRYKLLVFVISATLAGLAGSTRAMVFQLASLSDVHWGTSGDVVLMTIVGGIGTMFGPVVGAFIIIGMENYLAQFGSWVVVIEGVIFVVCVLTFRRGIVGELLHRLPHPGRPRPEGRQAASAAASTPPA
jgi:branched-chain amino acid transport system permease protein